MKAFLNLDACSIAYIRSLLTTVMRIFKFDEESIFRLRQNACLVARALSGGWVAALGAALKALCLAVSSVRGRGEVVLRHLKFSLKEKKEISREMGKNDCNKQSISQFSMHARSINQCVVLTAFSVQ